MGDQRDTFKYRFTRQGRTVETGATKNLGRTANRMTQKHGTGGSVEKIGIATTEKAARTWARERL